MRRGGGLGGAMYFESEPVRRQIAAAGVDAEIGEQLLSACELGAMTALNHKDDTDGEPE